MSESAPGEAGGARDAASDPWSVVFRRARAGSPWWHLARTLVQIVVVWTIALVVVPMIVVRVERAVGIEPVVLPGRAVWPWIGFAAMSALGLWSAVAMAFDGRGTPIPLDCPSRLVVRGPYRFVRNPMAIAGLGQGVFVAAWIGSLGYLALTVVTGVFWHVVVRPPEERDLERAFGASYRAYRARVPLWLPRPLVRSRDRDGG